MRLVYAGIFPRLCAYIVDGFVFYVITFLLGMLPIVNHFSMLAFSRLSIDLVWLHIWGYLFTLWYYVFFLRRYGATPGKMLFNMTVVMANGQPVTTRAVLLRYGIICLVSTSIVLSLYFFRAHAFLYYVFIALMMILGLWGLGSIYLLISRQDRRVVHDFIAGTVVIKRNGTMDDPELPKTWTTSSSSF